MEKINFEDLPSTDTPINANNLNTLQDNVENALNGNILYENASGSTRTITLSDSATNYSKFEVTYKCNTYGYKTDVIDYPNAKNIILEYSCYATETVQQTAGATYNINEKTITLLNTFLNNFNLDGTNNLSFNGANAISITKVIGYKS